MRNTIYIFLISIILLPACVKEDYLDTVPSGNAFGDFSFLLVHEEYAEGQPDESSREERREKSVSSPSDKKTKQSASNYDQVEFVVVDEEGYKVDGVKGIYDKSTSNMRMSPFSSV